MKFVIINRKETSNDPDVGLAEKDFKITVINALKNIKEKMKWVNFKRYMETPKQKLEILASKNTVTEIKIHWI